MVTCPACGGTSQDREFCDHCNADLMPPAAARAPAACPLPFQDPAPLSREQQQHFLKTWNSEQDNENKHRGREPSSHERLLNAGPC